MLNRCTIIGNLGKAAETKQAGSSTVTTFSVAVTEKWKDKNSQQQEKTEWFECQYWGKGGEAVSRFLEKGKQVYVEGRLQTRSYEKDGQKHYRTSINVERLQLLGGGSSGGQRQHRQDDAHEGGGGYDADDPLPF